MSPVKRIKFAVTAAIFFVEIAHPLPSTIQRTLRTVPFCFR
jgi:hypothetical protein